MHEHAANKILDNFIQADDAYADEYLLNSPHLLKKCMKGFHEKSAMHDFYLLFHYGPIKPTNI